MRVSLISLALVACGEAGGWSTDPGDVEAFDAESMMQRPGDLVGTLECGLATGDIEVEATCGGLQVTSCTDQVGLLARYTGGWWWSSALSGTDSLVPLPDGALSVRIRTVSGREVFQPAPVDCTDADSDGYVASEDCDDANAAVNPGATEICNGVDDDCDAGTSEDGMASWFDGAAWTDATGDLGAGFVVDVNANETLHLCAGTWNGTVNLLGWPSTLTGHPDAASVVLDAAGASNALTASGAGDRYVNDVTLTGATNSGVTCSATTYLHFVDSDIVDNDGSYAGGVLGQDCIVTMVGGSLSDNAGADAGGAYLFGGWIDLNGTTVARNIGNVGGLLLSGADVVATGSTFDGNLAFSSGRDLWLNEGTATVDASDFGPNSSAGDTSAVTLRYFTGAGYANANYGAGTFGGSWIGLGRHFYCSQSGSSQSCYATILP